MPVIILDDDVTEKPSTGARGEFGFSSSATMTALVTNLSARGEFAFAGHASPTSDIPLSARGEFAFDSSANISIDGSPDTFLSARGEFGFEAHAGLAVTQRLRARGLFAFEGRAGGRIIKTDTFKLEFIFDTLAATPSESIGGENGVVLDQARLTFGPEDSDPADWAELDIGDWSYTESEGTASSSVEFLLANPDDIEHFNTTTRYEFAVAQRLSGAWDEASVHRLIPNGEFRGSRRVVSWENDAPGDNIRVRIESDHDAKLAQTAETDLIIYDPSRDEVDEVTLLPVLDTLGTAYFPEVVRAEHGLTLHMLFREIFENRCGFAGVETNIPDYPIKRYDCAMGASLYDAMKPMLGQFEPVIYPDGNFLWIVDPGVTVPAGFPTARNIFTDSYKQYSDDVQNEKLDAYLVQYLEESSDYDFTTFRTDTPVEEELSANTVVTTERRYIEFRKLILPFVVIREALDQEIRTTKVNHVTVNVTTEDLTYTRGLISKRVKTVREWLPDIFASSASHTVYSMQETEREDETYTYRRHPFKPRQQYLADRTFSRTGLILNDPTNKQFADDFESLLRVAYRSGNLYEGMTLRRGPVHSRREVSTPLRNGQVRTHVIEVDEIKQLVVQDYSEERAGDIGLGTSEGQQRCLVFEDEVTSPPRDRKARIESIHVGEVPIAIAIPLVRRKLKARRSAGNSSLQLDRPGIDRNWKRGSTVSLRGRKDASDEPQFLGNFVTLGLGYTGGFGKEIAASYTLRKI